MSEAGPTIGWNPESGWAAVLLLLVFSTIGLFMLIFPRKVNQAQIWWLERELRSLRESPHPYMIRFVGFISTAIAVFIFIGLVRAAR